MTATAQSIPRSPRGGLQTHQDSLGSVAGALSSLGSAAHLPGTACSPAQSHQDCPTQVHLRKHKGSIPAPSLHGTALLHITRHMGATRLLPCPSRAANFCSQGQTTWFTPPLHQCLLLILTLRLLQCPEVSFGISQLEQNPARLCRADKSTSGNRGSFESISTCLTCVTLTGKREQAVLQGKEGLTEGWGFFRTSDSQKASKARCLRKPTPKHQHYLVVSIEKMV